MAGDELASSEQCHQIVTLKASMLLNNEVSENTKTEASMVPKIIEQGEMLMPVREDHSAFQTFLQ